MWFETHAKLSDSVMRTQSLIGTGPETTFVIHYSVCF